MEKNQQDLKQKHKDTKVIAFDLDDTLCYIPDNIEIIKSSPCKYLHCLPKVENINKLNDLVSSFNIVIDIYTARGMGIYNGNVMLVYNNLYELTKKQLLDWRVNYRNLIMGKASYDLLIDDKAMNVKDFTLNEVLKHLYD